MATKVKFNKDSNISIGNSDIYNLSKLVFVIALLYGKFTGEFSVSLTVIGIIAIFL